MKKITLIIGVVVLFLSLALLSAKSNAQFQPENNESVLVNNHSGTLYAFGSNITVRGNIDGDIFCAGQNITINANVRGDVICAGQNLRLDGTINGDIRLAGQYLDVAANISGSATVAAQSVVFQNESGVGSDLTAAGTTIRLLGPVARDVTATSEYLNIETTIGRNVTTSSDNINLSGESIIGGDLRYESQRKPVVSNDSRITGKLVQIVPSQKSNTESPANRVASLVLTLLALIILSLSLIFIAPRLFNSAEMFAKLNLGSTVLYGLAAVFLVPMLITLLLVTIVGIPIAVLLALSWMVAIIISVPVSAFIVGGLLLKNNRNVVIKILTGILILFMLLLVPVINVLAVFAAIIFGLGILIKLLLAWRRKPETAISAKPAYKKTTTKNTLTSVKDKNK